MTLLSLLIALLIEQLRPLPVRWITDGLHPLSRWLRTRCDDGTLLGGSVAWSLLVLPPSLLAAVLSHALWQSHPIIAFVFGIATLYLTLGFRYESGLFADINLALRMGQIDRARKRLAEWRGGNYADSDQEEIARLSIEHILIASHRNIFGIAFWFVILGPGAAVCYRLAAFLYKEWAEEPESSRFVAITQRIFLYIDWLPQRLTALSFSVVGNFEDAIYCWRAQSILWKDKTSAILLTAGAGALKMRLGMSIHQSGDVLARPELGVGGKADACHMQSALGLVWRSLVLCLLALTLVTIAGLVGNR